MGLCRLTRNLCDLIVIIKVDDIENQADAAVAQHGTAGNPGILNIELIEVCGQPLYHNLLLPEQIIREDTVHLLVAFHLYNDGILQRFSRGAQGRTQSVDG